jgi:cytochrome b561
MLHWIIAALILWNIYLGLEMNGLSSAGVGRLRVDLVKIGGFSIGWTTEGTSTLLRKFEIFQLHKSLGFSVLILSLVRLGFRLFGGRSPHYPDTMQPWEKLAASATHWSFYFLMIALPLTGWVIVSASPTNIPTLLFKTVPFPHIEFVHGLAMTTRRGLEESVGDLHSILAWITIAMILLHVGAALRHQFWHKDGVLYRMAPFPFLRFGART